MTEYVYLSTKFCVSVCITVVYSFVVTTTFFHKPKSRYILKGKYLNNTNPLVNVGYYAVDGAYVVVVNINARPGG